MKITDVKVFQTVLPYEQEFHFAFASISKADVIFVTIETDEGITGYGYAPGSAPMLAGELCAGMRAMITEVFRTVLIGQDPTNLDFLLHRIDISARHNSRAKASIDFALHDINAKKLGIPLYQYLGGKYRSEIPVMRMVSMLKPEEMARDALKLVKQGFKYLKLKVGVSDNPALDVARVKAVHEAVGDGITLVADVNQAYNVKTAIWAVNKMGENGLTMVEQPVPKTDYKGLAMVRKNVSVMVEADECMRSVDDAMRLIEMEAVDFISIKPTELGGLRQARKVATLCEIANIGCLIGAAPGSQFVDACNAHFIASTRIMTFGCEIGEFARMKSDPASGLVIRNGSVIVPEKVGIGVDVKLD